MKIQIADLKGLLDFADSGYKDSINSLPYQFEELDL